MAAQVTHPVDEELEAILRDRTVQPVFQPIVALADGGVIGYEALARGPAGKYHDPQALFRAAREAGKEAELDWLCAAVAGRRFLAADLDDVALFINLNPGTLATPPPDDLQPTYLQMADDREVVIEITEDDVTSETGNLLDMVATARRHTARIALDDIGREQGSLAAMPLINPDIIKLDRSIVQSSTASWAISHVVNAVLDEAFRHGAQILAEGIESPEHLKAARSLGAKLGQGWLFGRPGQLPVSVEPSHVRLSRTAPLDFAPQTPYHIVANTDVVTHISRDVLRTMIGHVEIQGLHTDDTATLLVNAAHADDLDDGAMQRYAYMTSRGVEVYVAGQDIPPSPGARIRGIPLSDGDPLTRERCALFIGGRFANGVVARECPAGPQEQEFDAGLCYDRDLVVEAALPLLHLLNPG